MLPQGPLTAIPYNPAPPWWVRHWKVLGAALTVLATFLLGLAFGYATAAVTTLPTASREASLCAALGTEAPCTYTEIGRLKGVLTFAAATDTDGVHTLARLFTARGTTLGSLQYNVATSEDDVVERVNNPASNWRHLIADAAAWAPLRELARVPDGVPVIVEAQPRKGGSDHTSDALASVALLKVRIGFMRLVP
jgi:hypothetical protein